MRYAAAAAAAAARCIMLRLHGPVTVRLLRIIFCISGFLSMSYKESGTLGCHNRGLRFSP